MEKRIRDKPFLFKKKHFSSSLIGFFVLFVFILISILNIYMLFFEFPYKATGRASSATGEITLEVLGPAKIFILHPLN